MNKWFASRIFERKSFFACRFVTMNSEVMDIFCGFLLEKFAVILLTLMRLICCFAKTKTVLHTNHAFDTADLIDIEIH